jgi:hypothetical protein
MTVSIQLRQIACHLLDVLTRVETGVIAYDGRGIANLARKRGLGVLSGRSHKRYRGRNAQRRQRPVFITRKS